MNNTNKEVIKFFKSKGFVAHSFFKGVLADYDQNYHVQVIDNILNFTNYKVEDQKTWRIDTEIERGFSASRIIDIAKRHFKLTK